MAITGYEPNRIKKRIMMTVGSSSVVKKKWVKKADNHVLQKNKTDTVVQNRRSRWTVNILVQEGEVKTFLVQKAKVAAKTISKQPSRQSP